GGGARREGGGETGAEKWAEHALPTLNVARRPIVEKTETKHMIWGAFDRNRLSQCIAGRDIHADFQLEIELPAGSELDFAVGVTPLHVGTAYRLSAHPDRGGAAIRVDR